MFPVGALAGVLAATQRGRRAPPSGVGEFLVVLRSIAATIAFILVSVYAEKWFQAPVAGMSVGIPLAMVFWRPSLFLERVFLPLGWSRVAYYFAVWTVPVPVLRGVRAGACVYSLRAALRRGPAPEAALALVDRALAKHKGPVYGPTLTAHAFLAWARGDEPRAQALFEAVSRLLPQIVSRQHRRFARQWLVAQAFERGNVETALRHADQRRFVPWSRWVADTLEARRGTPGAWVSLRRWLAHLLSTHRLVTAGYLESLDETWVKLPEPTGDVLADALTLHHRVLGLSPAAPGAMRALRVACSAWDAAAGAAEAGGNGALDALFARRMLALGGAQDPAGLAERLLRDVEGDLTAFAAQMDGPLSGLDGSPLGERVVGRVREQCLGDIEAMLATINARVRDARVLAMQDEWLEFANLRAAAERAARRLGPNVRRYYGERLFMVGTNWACLIYNTHKERPLGNTLFVWLQEACADLISTANAELAGRNAKCEWY